MLPHAGAAVLVAVSLLFGAYAPPATARGKGESVRLGSLDAGGAFIRFQDDRLNSLYGNMFGPSVALRAEGPLGLSPALCLEAFWASRTQPVTAFIQDGETRIFFLPVTLQVPWEWRLGAGWRARLGPQFSWAYLHETWSAEVPEAGVSADGSGNGGWLAIGLLGELRAPLGPAGALALTADWNWASADRTTVRGNGSRETSMEGGWRGLRLGWLAPWPWSGRDAALDRKE